jgi:hypothetical protein
MVSTATITSAVNAIEPNKTIIGTEPSGYVSDLEKSAFSSVPSNISQEQVDRSLIEAKKISKIIHEQMEEDINKSVDNLMNVIEQKEGDISINYYEPDTVHIGQNKVFTDTNYGDKGMTSWGLVPSLHGSWWDQWERKAYSATLAGPGGLGGVGDWAYVGRVFEAVGSSSQSCNIRMTGYTAGYVYSVAGAYSDAYIDLMVKDYNTGTTYSTSIWAGQTGGLFYADRYNTFNNGLSLTMIPGHRYCVYLQITTGANVGGSGSGCADFGTDDGDSGEYVRVDSITVEFN